MPTVLIAGANRGLGLEFARQYSAEGWRVIGTFRDPARTEALRAIRRVELHQLDVTDFPAVAALGKAMSGETIDLLIANPGVHDAKEMTLAALDERAWVNHFRVNSIAPLAVAAAFREAVMRSRDRRMVAISSILGSIASNGNGGLYAYRSSKAALNAAWRSWTLDNPELTCLLLHPGWVRTDMGGPSAAVGVEESISGMRKVIATAATGSFTAYDGKPLPW